MSDASRANASANTGEERATRPVILCVDDDAEVLRAVERDLRRQFATSWRVMRADSGAAALDALAELKRRAVPVALLLVDQRMPSMTGVELLEHAHALFPDAKSVLLTAYADTDAAISAINGVGLDFYILKPWDPPEEKLYPVVEGLLRDWLVTHRPAFEGVRVVGSRWSPASHDLRDFLSRNLLPFRFHDVETDEEGVRLLAAAPEGSVLPLVVLRDGTTMSAPTTVEVAEAMGMATRPSADFYDLVIVGGGPAGLAAAVYGASEGLRTALVEREAPGGQAGQSSRIENYLGFPKGVSGDELASRALTQALRLHAEVISPVEVCGLAVRGQYRVVSLSNGAELSCSALVVASGVSYRKLDVPGVERYTGAGVYYGAARSEGPSCATEDIVVVGGANSAGQAAMYFSHYARTVHVLVRSDRLEKGMSDYLVRQIRSTANIRVHLGTITEAIEGEERVQRVRVKHFDGTTDCLPASSVFVFIGAEPRTDWLDGTVLRDEKGFVLTGNELRRQRAWRLDRDPYLLETSAPGVFAVGDVRADSVKRVASAVGEGSIAVSFVHQYLQL